MLEAARARVQAALPAAGDRERRRTVARVNGLLRHRHLAQDRAGRAARARRAARGPRGRACCASWSPRSTSTRRSRSRPATAPSSTWWSADDVEAETRRARDPRPPGRHPADRAGLAPVLAAQRRRDPPPVPGHRRPRRDDRRRGRDPGAGEARVRARPGGEHDQRVHEPPLPRGAGGRQARPHRDRDRQRRRVASARSRSSSRRRPSAT